MNSQHPGQRKTCDALLQVQHSNASSTIQAIKPKAIHAIGKHVHTGTNLALFATEDSTPNESNEDELLLVVQFDIQTVDELLLVEHLTSRNVKFKQSTMPPICNRCPKP